MEEPWTEVLSRGKVRQARWRANVEARPCHWRRVWSERKVLTIHDKSDGGIAIYEAGGARSYILVLNREEATGAKKTFKATMKQVGKDRQHYRSRDASIFIQQMSNPRGCAIRIWKVGISETHSILVPRDKGDHGQTWPGPG
ncbi:hypothetical protein Scep_018713 [Stephania cephalantha]|uniref:Uncharacterized protein n=1 Tax=Stephania cephalantha TaxID=152367 RepID=A0AAP0I9J4_9MAGN